MSNVIRVAIVGIGGYGDLYLDALLNHPKASGIHFVGVVEPSPHRCTRLGELDQRKIPVYSTLRQLFDHGIVDLCIIASPIHCHAAQSCYALERGANVLCEKPLAGSLIDAVAVANAESRSGRFAAIGYQWAFSPIIQRLKSDITFGIFGNPIRLKTIVFFPRPASYFQRNDWAGRIRSGKGEWILDSPVNNAVAHYLHIMLYLLGSTREQSVQVRSVQAERYRVNAIENFDTAALRIMTNSDAEVLFYTTHATTKQLDPLFEFEFERATISLSHYDHAVVAKFKDGSIREYGPFVADHTDKLWQSVDALRGGLAPACSAQAALPQSLCASAAHLSTSPIVSIPRWAKQSVIRNGETYLCVNGLDEQLIECFEQGSLPAESGKSSWARAADPVEADVDEICHRMSQSGAVKVSIAGRMLQQPAVCRSGEAK